MSNSLLPNDFETSHILKTFIISFLVKENYGLLLVKIMNIG